MQKEHAEHIRPGVSLYPDDKEAQKQANKVARALKELQKAIDPSETDVDGVAPLNAAALAPSLATALAPPALAPAPAAAPALAPAPAEDLAPAPYAWVCPCEKVSGSLTRSNTKLTGNYKRKGHAYWLCDFAAEQCTDEKATEVTVLPVHLGKVEVKNAVRGGWVRFGGPEGATVMPPIDPHTVVRDLKSEEVIIYKNDNRFHVARVTGVYMKSKPPAAEVHRFGTYEKGGVLKGSLKPAYVDEKDGMFVFTNKPKGGYFADLQDVTGAMILARDVELDTSGSVPRDLADKIGSAETTTLGRSSESSLFWYEEYRLYRSLEDASKALQDTIVDPPDAQAHVVITVPRTSNLAPPGVAPEVNEYEQKKKKKIAENQAQLAALGILELSQALTDDTDPVPKENKRGRKRASANANASATDEDGATS